MRSELLTYRKIFEKVFSKYTAYPGTQNDIPSAGHCVVAAMYLKNQLGGLLVSCIEQGVSHWFNQIDGWYVDLTGDQFGYPSIRIWYDDNTKYKVRDTQDLMPEAEYRAKLFQAKCNNYIHDHPEIERDLNESRRS